MLAWSSSSRGIRPSTEPGAIHLLTAGVDVSVIALWLGHADRHSTDAYLHADMTIKQAALDRTRPPGVTPGNYHPEPDILAWLTAL